MVGLSIFFSENNLVDLVVAFDISSPRIPHPTVFVINSVDHSLDANFLDDLPASLAGLSKSDLPTSTDASDIKCSPLWVPTPTNRVHFGVNRNSFSNPWIREVANCWIAP